MAVAQKNTYVIGSNNDLTNALGMIDVNRIGLDLTYLEDDAGTIKVSVGSLIESQGSVYAVETAAETPNGAPPSDGDYLFFDDTLEQFVWSSLAGTYDPTRGGVYDASDRRQCRYRMKSATEWDLIIDRSAIGPTRFLDSIFDQNGHEVVGMHIEAQKVNVNLGPGSSTYTTTHVFTFTDNVQGVAYVEAYGYQLTGTGSPQYRDGEIREVTISGNQVTVVSFVSLGNTAYTGWVRCLVTAFVD
jgi:hypothetical protein